MARSTSGEMTSRERVLAAARGLPVDRPPVMYWLNPHAACQLMAEYRPSRSRAANWMARLLWRRFLRGGGLEAGEWTRALPLLFEQQGNGSYVLDLGADISIQSPELSSAAGFVGSIRTENGRLRLRGPLGGALGLGGIYMDMVDMPIKQAGDLAEYRLPAVSEGQFAGIRRFRRAHPDVCMLVEVLSFQQVVADYMMGAAQFMLALYDHPRELKAFMARLADWIVEIIRCAARAGADMVFFQDDYGATGRPLISPAMWEEFTYPHLVRFVQAAHEAGALFMLHSCGYQLPFLEHYVRAGVDVLQSFQPKAGNDFAAAFERYGERLTFATGIDMQQGEGMSPAELRESILQSYRIGRSTGRHILAMTHMMQYTMPVDNVRAIFDTVQEIQAGVHG